MTCRNKLYDRQLFAILWACSLQDETLKGYHSILMYALSSSQALMLAQKVHFYLHEESVHVRGMKRSAQDPEDKHAAPQQHD